MASLGVLFDIDALGGGFYGNVAYRILLRHLDRGALRGTSFFDGDTSATLAGDARTYCIAVECPDATVMADIETRLAKANDPSLYPPDRRFLRDPAIKSEPLVFAGRIDEHGMLVQCDTSWVIAAWQE
jgi:hypothetical protein